MSTENNNLFTDFRALNQTGAQNAGTFSASESFSGLTDSISPHFQGLIPEPTDALFDKMWESCDSVDFTNSSAASWSGRKEFQPLSPDAFMTPSSVLEGRGSAPAFDDVFPERLRPVQAPVQPVQQTVPNEIAYFEQLWETGDFPKKQKSKEQILWESEISNSNLSLESKESDYPRQESVDIPQLLGVKTPLSEERKTIIKVEEQPSKLQKKPVSTKVKETPVPKANDSKSWGGWTLSLISALTALIVGLFIFGWNMLPAYLVQYQIQQATGLSLRMKNVSQDYRAGMTSVESIQAFDSAQRPFFETGHVAFSSLPYFVGDNQQMKWAMVEGIRFASMPSYVSSVSLSLSNNAFNQALKSVGKELDDSQIEQLVKNSVSTIVTPYEQTVRTAEQEVKEITRQIQILQERLLASGEEASDAEKAQAASYQQRMQMALSNMSIEESLYNQRNAALLNNLHRQRERSRAEANIPVLTNGDVTEYLFGQDYMNFTGQLLYEIRQFCRWLPADLERTLGPVDRLDPASLSFRRIETQEELAVGQVRLTGQTQFMNQTVPFSAVISNYSTKPNDKPLTLDIAFGEDQSARLHLEAIRGENRTEIKVEFASSNVNPGTQFGLADGLHIKLEPNEKTPFIQTRSIQFVVSDGKIQGEYAMAQTAPSISIGVSGVRSESNVARLNELIESLEKITLTGKISGTFAKPELRVSSNLESWGHTVLALASNEYDMRMDSYRAVIEQKSVETIESEQQRISKLAQDVKVSADGNALLLNQLCSGVVESRIVINQPSTTPTEEVKADEETLTVEAENSGAELVANTGDAAPEASAVETGVSEDLPFPELPVLEPEPAQPSAQIAAGDVILDDLPPLTDNEEMVQTETESTAMAPSIQEPDELPALPDIEELMPPAIEEGATETSVDSQAPAVPVFPSLEELAPQNSVPLTAPTELAAPGEAMDINSPDANYQSPEMEFLDNEPMEDALPEDGVEQTGDAIPLVAPNTNTQRVVPPALPIIIEE